MAEILAERVAARPRAQPVLVSAADGTLDRVGPAQGHRRAAAAARRVVQARAARTHDARRTQRRGQDDAAADARGGDLDRSGRAERRQGRADRAARPAPAAWRRRSGRRRRTALREYLLSGCAEELQIEAELHELEGRMADGAADEALLARYARAQARLEARGGYLWRDRATSMARGLGFLEAGSGSPPGHLLRRAAHARVAGPGARHGRGRSAARRAHQPSGHRVAGVARADPRRARRGGRAGGA